MHWLLHWLYRIATTTSLKIIQKRARQPVTVAEIDYLEPYPDRLLDPATLTEQRKSVSLAFITALQLLPATQRAVLVLREVLTWTAAETATQDDHTVLARFIDAWHRRDINGLTVLLRTDAELRMPPETMEFLGRDTIIEFFATVPAEGRLETTRLIPNDLRHPRPDD